ncbi:hypothetical protein [Desulfocicer vacuolatum]|uniref:hypothetical protein n=1 Tax=Desulfocicer vacuolatum TaxID=2298 RepID=UPI000A032A0C|nr:hypothetical protein [Desulfocicer vacuolatum]
MKYSAIQRRISSFVVGKAVDHNTVCPWQLHEEILSLIFVKRHSLLPCEMILLYHFLKIYVPILKEWLEKCAAYCTIYLFRLTSCHV